MKLLPFLLLALILAPGVGLPQQTPRPAALVLVNWKYQYLAPLLTPEADGDVMETTLESLDPAFDVTVVANATREGMLEAIERFATRHAGNPTVFVYASVHGVQAGGRNYLAPVDANLAEFESQGRSIAGNFSGQRREDLMEALKEDYVRKHFVSIDDLISRVVRMGHGQGHAKMFFFDACRNPLPDPDASNLSVSKSIFGTKGSKGLAPVEDRPGVFVGTSAAANQVSQQAPGRLQPRAEHLPALRAKGVEPFLWNHFAAGGTAAQVVAGPLPPSLFTENFAAEIRAGGSLDEVFDRAAATVFETTQALFKAGTIEDVQTPKKTSLLYSGYFFRPRPNPGIGRHDPEASGAFPARPGMGGSSTAPPKPGGATVGSNPFRPKIPEAVTANRDPAQYQVIYHGSEGLGLRSTPNGDREAILYGQNGSFFTRDPAAGEVIVPKWPREPWIKGSIDGWLYIGLDRRPVDVYAAVVGDRRLEVVFDGDGNPNDKKLALRVRPSEASPKIADVDKGTVVEILDPSYKTVEGERWLYVRIEGWAIRTSDEGNTMLREVNP